MDDALLQQVAELPGLQAALKQIQDRINAIQNAVAGLRVPVSGPPPMDWGARPAPAPAPPARKQVSEAKLKALAKARAALARKQRATAGGSRKAKQVGKKAGTQQRGRKAVSATKAGNAAVAQA